MDSERTPLDADGLERRSLIKKGAVVGGILWSVPTIDSVLSVAAAQSAPTTAVAGLFKSGPGQADPPLGALCLTGATSNAPRGSATFTRTEDPPTICVTVTLSTGFGVAGRSIFILQSSGTTCVGGQATSVGTWAAVPLLGPQTFCAPIASGATEFVVAQQISGGGGNDGWSSTPVVLP
jgi:hypothetical protein